MYKTNIIKTLFNTLKYCTSNNIHITLYKFNLLICIINQIQYTLVFGI